MYKIIEIELKKVIHRIKELKYNVNANKKVKEYSSLKNDPFGTNIAESYDNYEPKKGDRT